ncbi:hypothetical protein D9611_000150 [Ephemerocybe angulata]|uniref:Uncharacterized protein n=2 Tax=Ephemerocybe angulata TaxID=980116 RepID=A0A8H5F709_9AGAR|nr:hypothetical protein D9611_000150 [Tulosesus angulatus]KAF6760022.1 Rec8 like protein-domain-containing protein [Tulosesus angulatus]
MFYSETILSRRGPLGRVWLAAHMERKLSKSQTLQTDIEQSVDAIMGQDIEVMALRLSGQLLLGVVRIYSRKAKYLLDDCNDALLKIKMAFRPGVVDLTEDQLNVAKTTITLQTNNIDLDLLLPDVNWDMDFEDRPVREQGHHQAHIEDITLPSANNFDQFDGMDPFDIGPSDGIGSQDFGELDLGINWGEEPVPSDAMSVDGSVGVGRDAPSMHDDLEFPQLNGVHKDHDMLSLRSMSRELSEAPFMPPIDMDFPDFGGMDLGDLGVGFDKPEEDVVAEKEPSSRASSPLTELPDTPVANEQALPDAEPIARPKKVREKKQIIDAVTELNEGAPRRDRLADAIPLQDIGNIVTEQRFLPRSSLTMRLMDIRDDPLAHFLPTTTKDNQTFFCAAPPGIGGELMDLFLRPIEAAASTKRRHISPTENGNKRMRLDEDDEIEQGRRAMSVAQSPAPFRFDEAAPEGELEFGDQSMAFNDDYQLDIANGVENIGLEGARSRSVSLMPSTRSRLSTPGADGVWGEGEASYADLSCPIAIFDSRHPAQSQMTQEEVQDVPELQEEGAGAEDKGYSKNTVKALSLIRKELQPAEDGASPKMSFNTMAAKASRRAAASFFFELLVLGTRDCVRLEQKGSFKDIHIQGKDKLWEQTQRHEEESIEV